MTKLWIVVADEGAARIFEQRHPDKDPVEVEALAHLQANADESALHRDASGRRSGSDPRMGASVTSSAGETQSHLEGERFAARVAQRLSQAGAEQRFDDLYIAAAPRFLGQLRKALSPDVMARVVGQLDKDLRQMQARELGRYVRERIASSSTRH